MSKKLITLRPMTPFYFGGEVTFGDDNKNYLVRSNYLPQQTAILGMLRHLVLIQNSLIERDPVEWIPYIGAKSFSIQNENSFELILNLSPVFLKSGDNNYTIQSIDWSKDQVKKCASPVVFNKADQSSISLSNNRNRAFIPELTVGGKSYDPKKELAHYWVNSQGDQNYLFDYINEEEFKKDHEDKGYKNGFFVEMGQIGITKNTSNYNDVAATTDKDKGFYKQYSYRFKDESMCFAIYAEIDDNALPNGDYDIHFGGENAMFRVKIEDANDTTFETTFNQTTFNNLHKKTSKAIVITSDTYCDYEILDQCDYAITESNPFKHIETISKKGGNYSKLNEVLFKSGKAHYLLKRGSVLYPNDQFDFSKLENTNFKNIGYNHYQKINY